MVDTVKFKLRKDWIFGQAALKKFNVTYLLDNNNLRELKIVFTNKFQVIQNLLEEEEIAMKNKWK